MSFSNFLGHLTGGIAFGLLTGSTPYGWYSPYCCAFYPMPVYTPRYYYPSIFPETPIMPTFNYSASDSFSYLDSSIAQGFESIRSEINDTNSNYNKYIIQPIQQSISEYYDNLSSRANYNFRYSPTFTMPYSFTYQYQQPPATRPEKPESTTSNDETEKSKEKDEKQENVSQQPISYDAKKLKDKWSKKQPQLTDQFYSRVVDISKKIKCNPEDLMAVMNLETKRTFSPSERNNKSSTKATGLIQFTRKTALNLGTSIDDLAKMTAVEQLDYVEKYLVDCKKGVFKDNYVLTAGDLYALVFQPAKAKNNVLARAGTDEYEGNKLLDVNKDKVITKTDLEKALKPFMA